jgi:hypothetical protein
MTPTFKKLNLKDQQQIVILNSPESFEPELKALDGVRVVRDVAGASEIQFSLAFVTKQQQVDALAKAVGKKAKGDAVVWFAYPKGSSKKYKSEISGWQVLGTEGFEPVRMVAIDEDWTAKRFRRVDFIKNMTRPEEYKLTKRAQAGRAKK